MASAISETWFSDPNMKFKVDYSTKRSGSNVTYTITVTIRQDNTGYSSAWYNNILYSSIKVDGADKGGMDVKPQTSGDIKGQSWSASKDVTISKTSGSTSLQVQIIDRAYGSGWEGKTGWVSGVMSVPAAGSSMGTNTAGSTLNGPTINVTKYDSSFIDNITLTYNNKTITRNNFTSSKLTFTEAERLLIFQAQGAGTTQSWSISGTTYSNQAQLGTFSGSVNISTEALSTISSVSNFNVGSATTYSTTNACGGKSRVVARVTSNSGTSVYDSGKFSGTKSGQSCIPTASTIYSSNTSTPSGTIYWSIESFINDTSVGTTYKTCTYTFLQSSCGPSITTFQYAITDAGTRALMSSAGTYYNYNVNTDLGKFIKSKTTLGIKIAGSAQQSATVTSMWIEVPGQSNVNASSTSGTQTLNTSVLTSDGTLNAVVKDSRGFTARLSFTYTLNDYYIPSYSTLSVVRNPMSSTDATQDKIVKITTEISIPSYMATYIKANTGTYYLKFQYKAESDSTWTTNSTNLLTSATQSGSKLTLTDYATTKIFDQNTQYLFRLVITEYYTTSSGTTSNNVTIPISAPLISRRSRMVGINKIPTLATLDVGGNISSDGNIVAKTYVKSGSYMQVNSYITFPTKYTSSNNACTLRFKRSDGYYDIIRVTDGAIYFSETQNNTEYELIPFQVVSGY